MTTLSLFEQAGVEVAEPEPVTELRVGSRVVRIPLRRKRREACNKLMGILEELEGKDIYIGCYEAGGRHFWFDNLKLGRLQLEWHPLRLRHDPSYLPTVIVLWGNRGGSVRIFTNFLVAVREQEYSGYWLYLVDFRNGLGEHPIDSYRTHYACLQITRFKD